MAGAKAKTAWLMAVTSATTVPTSAGRNSLWGDQGRQRHEIAHAQAEQHAARCPARRRALAKRQPAASQLPASEDWRRRRGDDRRAPSSHPNSVRPRTAQRVIRLIAAAETAAPKIEPRGVRSSARPSRSGRTGPGRRRRKSSRSPAVQGATGATLPPVQPARQRQVHAAGNATPADRRPRRWRWPPPRAASDSPTPAIKAVHSGTKTIPPTLAPIEGGADRLRPVALEPRRGPMALSRRPRSSPTILRRSAANAGTSCHACCAFVQARAPTPASTAPPSVTRPTPKRR